MSDITKEEIDNLKEDLADCIELIRELSTDLESEVESKYNEGMLTYSSCKRKYDQDILPVFKAKLLLERLDHAKRNN